MLNTQPERVMVLWVPELDEELRARMRSRERPGEAEDPELVQDRERRWEQLLRSVEQLVPGIEPMRQGMCAMRARGPARYYGGESDAAIALLACVTRAGIANARAGVASGRFAAEQAARANDGDPGVEAPAPGVRLVAASSTALLLGPLPIGRAADEGLAEVLLSLGIRTLGAFAALPESSIRERFGPAGVTAHRKARGLGAAHAAEVLPRDAPKELAVSRLFEPPLDGADQLAFACSAAAEELIRSLIDLRLVCTELRVELIDDIGVRHERLWAHPTRFTAADTVNRIRWQAGAVPRDPERGGSGIAEVRLAPVRLARAADHEPGLWSTAPDERVHHHLSRVQSLLGHEGVGTGELTGGRLSADRQRLVPWGTAALSQRGSASGWRLSFRARSGPWPGRLPGANPSAVFAEPKAAALLGRDGAEVDIDDEQLLSVEPARLGIEGRLLPSPVRGWSAPWPLRERWWAQPDGVPAVYRVQILLENGDAWLLRYAEPSGWSAEAHYA